MSPDAVCRSATVIIGSIIAIFISDGTIDHPDAGLLIGNGYDGGGGRGGFLIGDGGDGGPGQNGGNAGLLFGDGGNGGIGLNARR